MHERGTVTHTISMLAPRTRQPVHFIVLLKYHRIFA
jgi:hypothetical protein